MDFFGGVIALNSLGSFLVIASNNSRPSFMLTVLIHVCIQNSTVRAASLSTV